MNEARSNGDAPSGSGVAGRGSLAISLFGGAILATVATASVAQVPHYFDTVSLLAGGTVSSGYVVLGGNLVVGDGGGGTFMPGPTCSGGDGGIVFQDGSSPRNCFYRVDPTHSVREWGARCDVVVVNSPGTVTWNPGTPASMYGTLTVPTALLTAPPQTGESIAISQIGSPTLWESQNPAVSLTRFATLGGTQVNYHTGDLISFAGGTFSQQAAIIVDSVDSAGSISQSHFLWGGLYKPGATLPTGPMAQDNTQSYCGETITSGVPTLYSCGTIGGYAVGAVLIPAWSGWSLLNSQSISNPGTGYMVGQIVTLGSGGGAVNQSQAPQLIVEAINNLGGVTAYDWLDYGSFSTLPTDLTTLTATTSGGASGLAFHPVAWTQGPYASTIISAGTVVGTGTSTIVVDGTAAFPGTIAVQSFYYGHDDSRPLGNALAAKPASALIVPAGCGTTTRLNLSQLTPDDNNNPTLVGGNPQSSGIYAFAVPLTNRGTTAVLGSVLNAASVGASHGQTVLNLTVGGGMSNLLVEGFGIPEGYGYWGLAGQTTSSPLGYVGPLVGTPNFSIPAAGTAVEIDKVRQIRIDNVHVTDGGMGVGNATLQLGLNESDPTDQLKGDVANIVFTDSRVDSNPLFLAGPGSPDVALRINSHDSVYRNITAYDGMKADILLYKGELFGQTHVGSSTVGATIPGGPPPTNNWATIANFGLAGAADYGVYATANTSLSQTRCDIANLACVFLSVYPSLGRENPGQITDTEIGCATFNSVPNAYVGVRMSAQTLGTTVGGTAAAGKCAMPPAQLISLVGGPPDPTSSLCNNSNAPVAGCTGYQGGFPGFHYYTQPAVTYGTVTLSGSVGASTLYAVPFYSPAGGGTITRFGLQVVTPGATGVVCALGAYNAFAGRPTSLIANGGTVSISGTGAVTTTATAPIQLAPATLYFLAVGCNGGAPVLGVANTGGAAAALTGAADFATVTSELTAPWPTFASSLPLTFGTASVSTSHSVPNVFVTP